MARDKINGEQFTPRLAKGGRTRNVATALSGERKLRATKPVKTMCDKKTHTISEWREDTECGDRHERPEGNTRKPQSTATNA